MLITKLKKEGRFVELSKLLGGSKTEKSIDSPVLKIKGNILAFHDYFIQISNISAVSVAPIPKDSYPPLAYLFLIVGFTFFTNKKFFSSFFPGLILIGLGAFWIYAVYKRNEGLGNYLRIVMNSGKEFIFQCNNRTFLDHVLEVLQECVENGTANVVIDLKDTIVTIGDGNIVQKDSSSCKEE